MTDRGRNGDAAGSQPSASPDGAPSGAAIGGLRNSPFQPARQLHPSVWPQVMHFMQVPLRTMVKLPQLPQASPS